MPKTTNTNNQPTGLRKWLTPKKLYAYHSWIGLVAALLMLLIGFTGAAAVFKHEIDWLLTPALRVSPGPALASLDDVVVAVSNAYPEHEVRDIELHQGKRWAHVVKVHEPKKHEQGGNHYEAEDDDEAEPTEVFVNPYNAQITGSRNTLSTAEAIKKFHTNMWLNLNDGALGKVGRVLVCFFGLMLLVLSITGFVIYRNKLKSLLKIRTRFGRRIMMSDMHKVLGVWTIGFNFMIGVTATAWGIKEVPKLFETKHEHHETAGGMYDKKSAATMSSNQDDKKNYAGREMHDDDHDKEKVQVVEVASLGAGIDGVLVTATTQFPEMRPDKVKVHRGKKNTIEVHGDVSGTIMPQQKMKIETNSKAGNVLLVKDERQDPVTSRLYKFMEPLHFGTLAEGNNSTLEYTVKFLWAFLGLSPGILSITGALMYLLRKKTAPKKVTVPARAAQSVRELAVDAI